MRSNVFGTGAVLICFLILGLVSEGQEAESDDGKSMEKTAPAEGEKAGKEEKGKTEEKERQGNEHEDVEEIVVTATRTPQALGNVPASTTVITSEEIKRRNLRNVDEALEHAVGAYSRRGKGMTDLRAGITLRGFADQKRTLILLNGRPIHNAYTGEVPWSGIPVDDVERIEVVRGPNSALYGGNAMGGVINIITKKPMKREVKLRGGYGSDDTYMEHFSYGDRFFDRLSVLFSYDQKATAGYRSSLTTRSISRPGAGTPVYGIKGFERTTTSTGDLRYIVGDTGNNWWDEESIATRVSFDIDNSSTVDFEVIHSAYDYGYDWGRSYLRGLADNMAVHRGNVLVDGRRFSVYPYNFIGGPGGAETNFFSLNYENELTDWLAVKAGWGLMDQPENWYITPSSQADWVGGRGEISETPSRTMNFDLQTDIAITKRQLLTLGMGFRNEQARNREWELANWRLSGTKRHLLTLSEGRSKTWSLYGQDEIEILDSLTLYAGLRMDHWRVYDGYNHVRNQWDTFYRYHGEVAWSPKVGFTFKPFKGTTFRGAAGTAFRPPNVYELYRTYRSSWGTVYESNPDLTPETTKSWELGLEQKLPTKTKLSATIFQNYIDDLVYTAATGVANINRRQNAAKARGDGIELGLDQEITSWLDGFVNWSHINTTFIRNPFNPLSEHHQVTYTPKDLFNFGVNVHHGPLTATLCGRHVSKVYTNEENRDGFDGVPGSYDSFFTSDAKVSWKLTKNAEVSFSVDNIFDERYFQSYLAPGRTVFADLRLTF